MVKYPIIRWFFIVWALSSTVIYFGCDIETWKKPIAIESTCADNKSPSCWSDKDWEVFCERVTCKPEPVNCWKQFKDCELYDKPRPE